MRNEECVIPNKAGDRETYRESVSERHMARHSQREAVLYEWAATENNMPDSAPVCVWPGLILSRQHLFIMRPGFFGSREQSVLEMSGHAGRVIHPGAIVTSKQKDTSRATRRLQTLPSRQSIVKHPKKLFGMKIRGD